LKEDLFFPFLINRGTLNMTISRDAELQALLKVGKVVAQALETMKRALFATHGTVDKVSLVNDRETGRPRGFGFVEMPNADATRAMQALDGKDFGGRPLKVNEAQERERGAPRGNFGGGGGGGRGRF
jgi:RNA recognition motif-containing protein